MDTMKKVIEKGLFTSSEVDGFLTNSETIAAYYVEDSVKEFVAAHAEQSRCRRLSRGIYKELSVRELVELVNFYKKK